MKLLFPFISVFFFLFSFSSYASHVPHGSIKYKFLGGNKYYVEAAVVRDCSGTQLYLPTITITAKCSTSSSSSSIALPLTPFAAPSPSPFGGPYSSVQFTSGSTIMKVQEISDVCDKILNPNKTPNSRCRINTSNVRGFTLFTYSGIVTLSSCNYWTLGFMPVCCRNSSNSNISSGSTWIEAKLNSKDCPTNSSPNFGNEKQPMFNACVGQTGEYHFGSTDPDGDSLTYKLVCAKQSTSSCVTYRSGFSATSPLAGAKLDTNTGRFTFKPAVAGKRVVSVLISEYDRCTKKWCGSTLRDIIMRTFTCTRNYPKYTYGIHKVTGATKIDSFRINVKAGSKFTIEDTLYAPSTTDTLVIYSDYAKILPGSKLKITQIAKNKLHYKFSWTPPLSVRGTNYLHLTLSDDACDYPRKRRMAIAIDFTPQLSLSKVGNSRSDTILLMKGDTLNLASGGRGMVSWKTIFGDSLRSTGSLKNVWGDTVLGDTNSNIKFRPLLNTKLAVFSKVKNSCSNTIKSDTVFIKIIPPFQVYDFDTTLCANVDSFQLNARTDSSYSFTYLWSSANGTISNIKIANPFVSGNIAGDYWVIVTSSHGGERTAKMTIDLASEIPKHHILSNADSICLGGSVELEAKFKNVISTCQSVPKKYKVNRVLSHDSLNVTSNNNLSGIYPNPFANNHPSSKQLFLYRAKDLNNKGIKKGTFQSISFYVDSIASDTSIKTFNAYNIELACTKDTSLRGWPSAKLTKVVSNKSVKVKIGWNEIEFDTAYHWDGSSNLFLQLCYDNTGKFTDKSYTAMQEISYNGNTCVYSSNPTCASQNLGLSNLKRVPVVKFGYAPDVKASSLLYSWIPASGLTSPNKNNTTAKPLITTTYSIAVTDSFGACSDTTQKTIYVVKAKLNAGKDISQCVGSIVTFNPTVTPKNGGTYTWFPTADFVNANLKNATFNFKRSGNIWLNYADSFGCEITDTIAVTSIAPPSPFFTTKNKFCETETTGLLNPTNSGGTFTGLGVSSTNFNASDPKVKPSLNSPKSVSIKHSISKNGCNADTMIIIQVYPVFDTVYSGNRVFCSIDPIENLITRHSGGTWSGSGVVGNTFNPVIASVGSHTIRLDSTGFCGNNARYLFKVLISPDHDFPDTVYGCNNKPAVLDAGNNGAVYSWNTGAKSQTITATTNGKYWVKISIGSKCETTDTTQVKITAICLGVSAVHSSNSSIKIFPNPTSQFLNLESGGENIETVKLLNLTGQIIKEFEVNSKNTILDLGEIASGNYLIQVKRNGSLETFRIVIGC